MDSKSAIEHLQTVAEILAAEKRSAFASLTPSLIRLYAVLAPACLVVYATNGFDSSALTGLQGVAAWTEESGSPKGTLLGITKAAREWSILSGSSIMIIGVLIQCLSHSIGLFIGGRIVVGFGITLALAAAPVLISKLAHPRHRVLFGSLYNTCFYLGALTAGWVVFGSTNIVGSWAWRLVQMIFVWFLDESPRWLYCKDRGDEALAIIVKHHGNGDPNDPLVIAEFREMEAGLQLKEHVKGAGPGLFFKTPANRKRLLVLVTLAVFEQWSGNGLVSYYLTRIFSSIGITSQWEQTLLNGVISTVNNATALFAAVISTKIGRRWMFVGGGIAVYNTQGTSASSQAGLAFIFIYYAAFNLCLNPLLFLYPTEILPFRLRALGLSILVFANKAASCSNQFVNPIGMDSLGWKYYLFYVVWLVVEIIVFYFLYPETRGYTLERMDEVFRDDVKHDVAAEKCSVLNEVSAIERKEER
ncbi:hypothetical protein CSOJ01_12162 [Colletotrichum sojae]|uniref:Major facilitator superfamily (MFS) profile domain-containing protein n=1 Tax=Colletotrichum sojae TaxID=2175907 RepID=A0A8H6IW77_9PEZI|nr:hypothetical protein CSOJ01_12162 [Colletotrichum sojae]